MSDQILAPLPGVFYRRPSPNEAPYVEEGGQVQAGDPIGMIEVMKSFSLIEASSSGAIHFLVEDGGIVDVDEPIAELT